jgi:hypothetical protein
VKTCLVVALFFPLAALAQWRPPINPADVCGADESCAAVAYTATTTSGTGFTCSGVGVCVDQPGACNEIETNVSGDLILGGTDCNPTIRWGDSSSFVGNTWTNTNGNIVCRNSCAVVNDFGTEPVKISDAHGLQVNATTALKGLLLLPVTIDVSSIAATTCATTAATVAGVEASDYVFATPNFDLSGTAPNVIVGNCRVTNAGTDEVTCLWCNAGSAGNENPASGSYLFLVMRP